MLHSQTHINSFNVVVIRFRDRMIWVNKKNTIPSHMHVLNHHQMYDMSQWTEQMYQISVQEFKEHVCLSQSWSELSCRCGQPVKFGCSINMSVVRLLKQKVLFLKRDTQHFKYSNEQYMNDTRAKRAWIGEIREGGAGGGGGRGGKGSCEGSTAGAGNMYQIAPEEFSELVGVSHSWQELARRCGARVKKNDVVYDGIITVLKQKVLFLKLDTQHFRGKEGLQLDLDLGEM